MMIKREEKKMEDNFINFRSKEIYVCMIIIYTGSSYTITVICIQSEDSPCPSHFFSSVCSSHTLSLNFPLLSPFTRCLFSSFFFSLSHVFSFFLLLLPRPTSFPSAATLSLPQILASIFIEKYNENLILNSKFLFKIKH